MPGSFQKTALSRPKVHRDLALLLVTVVACAAPFLRQPFHMDDNFYMDMARNAQVKPLYPNDTPYVFEGRSLPDMGSHSHPPLMTYFLAVLQHCAGEGAGKEWIYHFAALIFPVIAVWGFYFFSMRMVSRPLWPALALACCPLFLVMQHTLMTDVPTLAFWLAAIASFVWATDLRRPTLYALSAVFQFAAMFTSYQSFALFPLLGFYQIRKRGKAAGWIALVAPVVLMSAWFAVNYFHYHRWLLGDTYGYMLSRNADVLRAFATRLVALFEYQGWLILFPLFFLYVFGRALKGRVAGLALLAGIYLAQLAVPQYRWFDKMIFVVGLVTGFLVFFRMAGAFAGMLRGGQAAFDPECTEGWFLELWYFGVAASCLLLFTEGSARYILPLIPPVLLHFFRELETMETYEYRLPRRPLLNSAMLASGSLVVSLSWGLVLSHADQEFARIYPRAAREFAEIAGGLRCYYAGEWGFRYYMKQSGVEQFPPDESQVSGGSLLAVPRMALPYDIPADLRSMSMPLQTLIYELRTPLRTLDWQTPAGFYSTGWGLIPFSFSRRSLEAVEIQQVNFLVERLPWAKAGHAGTEGPWSGYLSIQGKSPLALLAKPGTRILYSWTSNEALELQMKCGVSPDGYTDGETTPFEFDIRQCDSRGNILVRCDRTLTPGVIEGDRKWQDVRISLKSRAQGGEVLELRFLSIGKVSAATGAFAEAILSPARR